jgi:hypothetical protein
MGGVQLYLVCPQCSEEMAFPGGIGNMALRESARVQHPRPGAGDRCQSRKPRL